MGTWLPRRARGRWFALASAMIASAVVLACNALSGIGDLTVENVAESGDSAPESTPPDTVEGGVMDAGDTRDTRDAAPDVVIDPPAACPSAGRTCVPMAPSGWDGPLIVYDEASSDTPACPTSMALTRVDAHQGQPTGSHTCTTCSCGPVTGTSCAGSVKFFTSSDCSGAVKVSGALSTTTCVTSTYTVDSMLIETTSIPGSCVPNGGASQPTPIAWPTALRGCGAPMLLTDGCKNGEVCAPDPPQEFRARHCVARTGDVACPDAWSVKLSGFAAANDTRGCTNCSCGAATGVACGGTVQHYTTTRSCSGPMSNISLPSSSGQCLTALIDSAVRLAGPFDASSGSCAPAGTSTPTGGVANKDPVTVCCMP